MGAVDQGTGNVAINSVLRGTHIFYVAVTQRPFILSVSKQDANMYVGEDTLSIQVFKGDQKLAEKVIPDDGITEKNNLMATPQKEQITLDNPDLGVYKVTLKDNSDGGDVRITNITVNQPKLVFASPVFPLGTTPTTLVTNSKNVQMITHHPESTQSARLDDSFNLDILKVSQKYSFDLDEPATGSANVRDLHSLVLPKNDITISGDGVFAFSKDAFFDPQTVKTVDISKLSDINQADYVVANYTPVTKDGDWLDAQIFIDPKNIKIDGDTLYFSLESPNLETNGGEITVDSLEITTTKPSWFGKVLVPNNPSTGKNSFWQRFTSWLSTFINGKTVQIGATQTPTPKSTEGATQTPTPTITSDIKQATNIMVQNGGTVAGGAKRFVESLGQEGYKKAYVGNDVTHTYKNATIIIAEANRDRLTPILTDLSRILKVDYNEIVIDASGSGQTIKIILGAK